MKKIFGLDMKSCNPHERSSGLREVANKMITEKIIPEVKNNNQINRHALSYLLILRVQLSRCRNASLMCRT